MSEKKSPLSDNLQVFTILGLILGAMMIATLLLITIRPVMGDFDPETFDGKDIKTFYLSAVVSQISLLFVGFLAFLRIMRMKAQDIISVRKLGIRYLAIAIGALVVGLLAVELLSFVNLKIIEQFPQTGFLDSRNEQLEHYKVVFDPKRTDLFVLAIVFFAAMPAIIEELVFRGLLLKKLFDVSSGKKHFAVWVSAAIFAAVHVQPWNLLPMIFMGAMLGYLYVYLKDIRYSMVVHFLFNCINLAAAFYFPELA